MFSVYSQMQYWIISGKNDLCTAINTFEQLLLPLRLAFNFAHKRGHDDMFDIMTHHTNYLNDSATE